MQSNNQIQRAGEQKAWLMQEIYPAADLERSKDQRKAGSVAVLTL
jgi:hypothetical protein